MLQLQNLLTKIYIQYDRQKILEKEQCHKFNIFSILNMERKEVETHSFFIYELLNPNGSHNQKEVFLNLFLENVLHLKDYGEIINKSIKREDLTAKGKRIDFTIETSKYQIAIEMKIDADDGKEQLQDYYIEMSERCNCGTKQQPRLYYLTLFGNLVNEKSLGEKISSNDYQCLSFSNDILNWINLCIKEVVTVPTVRELLHQYMILLEKITNQDKGLKMNTIKIISDSKENFIASYEIYRSFEDMAFEKEKIFWEDLLYKLKKNNVDFLFDETLENDIRKAQSSDTEVNIQFRIAEMCNNCDFMLQVGAKRSWGYGNIYATIYQLKENKWNNGSENYISKAVNNLKTANFQKKSWAYGTAIINNHIQLRNENLYDAFNHMDNLVETIVSLIKELKAIEVNCT